MQTRQWRLPASEQMSHLSPAWAQIASGTKHWLLTREEGIRTDFILQDSQIHSGIALIMVNPNGENMIGVGPGANSHLTAENVSAASTAIQEADCVLLQLEIPLAAVQAAAEIAHRHNVQSYSESHARSKITQGNSQSIDYLTPNETEMAILAGENI